MIAMIKCHECGHETYFEFAKNNWIITRMQNAYCPRCILRLVKKLKIKEYHKNV